MAYNVRIFYYASGKQVRVYDRPVRDGFSRGSPVRDGFSRGSPDLKFDNQGDGFEIFPGLNLHDKQYLWRDDFLEGWEHFETDPEERRQRSLISSMNRTKQAIFGVARANVWEYFLTLTFDQNKTNSADYDLVLKRVKIWLNHLKQRNCKGLYYLIVPELHADKKHWHLHGLLGGCDGLKLVDSGHRDAQDRIIYNLPNWRYGFSTVTPIGDMARVSNYITKYITKDLCEVTKNKHRYLVSRNCLRADDVCEELLILDEEDLGVLQEDMSEKIQFCKSQEISLAHQIVTYYELTD